MKRVIVFFLACFLILSSVSVSLAAAPVLSATRWCSPSSGFGGGSRVIPTDTVISYSDLCDYRSSANRWLGSGMYPGFHGYATIVYTGSFYYIQMTQDGDTYWLCNSSGGRYRTRAEYKSDDTPTTVPSTTPPSIDKHESTESDNTYISDPSSPSNSTTELNALNRLIQFTYSQIKAIHGLWRTNIKMYNIQIKLRSLMWNMIDGVNNITEGIYEQVDLFNAYLPRLDDIHSRLSNIGTATWSSVDVQGRILSSVSGIASRLDALNTNTVSIGSRLDSVISNGAVQVGSASLEARLDKLISMYSKVNSVVLDTASLTSNSIKAAVGGELEDVVFWGTSGVSDKKFVVSDGTYTLNGAQYDIPVPLLGFTIGTTVPASLDTADTALMAGVWRYNEGGTYRLSDTYNAATGEYVRRVGAVTYDGSEDWKMVTKDGCYLFYLSDPAFSHTNGNICSVASQFSYVPYNSAFSGNASDSAIAYNYRFTVFAGKFIIICQSPSVAAWKTWLKQQVAAGTPYTVWYQDVPTTTVLDRTTVAIPEGDSSIFGYRVRITGKYETYDSYTQTADIIAAINNLQLSSGVGADLTAITTRLDTLINKTSDTVVNVVNNNTYITNVFQLDDDTSVVDTTKDGVGKVSGLFKWLWNNTFKSAFTHADITKLDGLL